MSQLTNLALDDEKLNLFERLKQAKKNNDKLAIQVPEINEGFDLEDTMSANRLHQLMYQEPVKTLESDDDSGPSIKSENDYW